MKYRKTALIEAEQFDAVQWEKGLYHAIEEFDYAPSKREKARRKYCRETGLYNDTVHGGYRLKTLEGPMRLRNGDWIATGVNGEHWAIADDVFKKTYTKLPVIPEAVADYIESFSGGETDLDIINVATAVLGAVEYDQSSRNVSKWITNFGDEFARAYLDGYVIGEEK